MHTSILPIMLLVAAPDAPLPLLPVHPYPSTYLVRGTVIGGCESPRYAVNEIRIDHIYHGPESLLRRTFSAISADELPEGSNPYITIPSLRVGETLIAVIYEWNGKLSASQRYAFTPWPVRASGNPDWMPSYDTIKAFAEAVERVSQFTGRDEATMALKRLASDGNPYISSWAIARLPVVSQRSAEVFQFLKHLVADDGVPIQGQVELDRVLLGQDDGSIAVEHHDPQWQLSEARLKLFRRWFVGAPSKRDAELVVRRLDAITQHPDEKGFRQNELLELVAMLAKNDRFSLSARQRTASILSWAAKRYEEGDEKVFHTAVELVSGDLPEDVRRRVAEVIETSTAIDDARRSTLTDLLGAEKAESVAATLKQALARPNGQPERPFAKPRGSKK